MPFFDIHHTQSLSDQQKDDLAEAITKVHTELFSAPRLFVNVVFTNGNKVQERDVYAGGQKKTQLNHIIAHIRSGPSRPKKDLDKLAAELDMQWKKIVGDEKQDASKECTVFVLNDIAAGIEKGFTIPAAGEDKEWLKANLDAFRALANKGDESFQALLQELEHRQDFQGILPSH